MKMNKSPIAVSFWYTMCNVLASGTAFVMTIILARLLSTEELGQVTDYQSWEGLISILITFTVWGGVCNVGLTKYSESRNKFIASLVSVSLVSCLLSFIIAVLFIDKLIIVLDFSSILIVSLFIEVMISIPTNVWLTKLRYDYNIKVFVILSMITSIAIPILNVTAIYFFKENKVEAKILSTILIELIIAIPILVLIYTRSKTILNISYWKYILTFTTPLIPHYLSMQILNQSDRIMIGRLCDKSTEGIYGLAYSFSMMLNMVVSALNSSITPYIYKEMKNNQYNNIKKLCTYCVIIIGLIDIVVICFLPNVFMMLYPVEYASAINVIPVIAISVYFLFLYPLFSTIEFYYEETKYVSFASFISSVINIVLNYIFIPKFGYVAAGYTTLFCYMLLSIFHYFVMKYILKKRDEKLEIYDYNKIWMITFGFLVISFIVLIWYRLFFIRVLFLLISLTALTVILLRIFIRKA